MFNHVKGKTDMTKNDNNFQPTKLFRENTYSAKKKKPTVLAEGNELNS